jgi:nucleotide-binding universal stress UspA family protein
MMIERYGIWEAGAVFERILVPVDGSNISVLLAQMAANIAAKFGSEVVLLHVLQLPLPMEVLNPGREEPPDIYGEIKGRVESFGRRVLKNAALEFSALAVPTTEKTVWGDPAGEIVKEAHQGGYHLIVIGSRGLDDMEAWLMGSVSNKVVQRSRCPVLVVR